MTSHIQACAAQTDVRLLMLLDEGLASVLDPMPFQWLGRSDWAGESTADLTVINSPNDLMTVLYTSGSTGHPKGVMLSHRGYTNRIMWMQKTFPIGPGDRIAQKTSCCFDVSVWEIFWPLMMGATVCPVHKTTVANPWLLAEWLEKTQISLMHFVPSLFGEFIHALENESYRFSQLRWLIFSGEALPVPFVQKWMDRYGMSTQLANLYGPTEASIDVSCHILHRRPGDHEHSIPIGKAIENVFLVLVDEHLRPVGKGQLGELCIGGVQLAKGYLKDPEKTKKAFQPNPFPEIPGDYIYKTGDLCVELADGGYDYRGRIDSQVKIRGFRIELGEVESVLNRHPAVQEAGVIALDYEEGQKRLVAAIAGTPVKQKVLREHLATYVTDYMIPHRFVWFDSLPKNPNGKLDRNRLRHELSNPPANTSMALDHEHGSATYLPLGPAQKWLLNYFDAPYRWCGYTRFFYHQPLDIPVFEQALTQFVERHDILRTTVVYQEGQWQQKTVSKTPPFQASFFDGTHLSSTQRDEQVRHLIQEMSQQLTINCWPLMKVLVVQVNQSHYDISIVGHHLIGDLLSNTIVFKEFWLTYTQRLGNQTITVKPVPSYMDFVRYLVEEDRNGHYESHVEYWQKELVGGPPFEMPIDQQTGENLERSARLATFRLSPDDSQYLLSRTKRHYQSNLYPLLLAPLYTLMAEWSQQERIIISHRSHGRDLGDRDYMETIGNFAVNYPLAIAIPQPGNWAALIQQLQDKFAALPAKGVTYDWIGDRLPASIYPDAKLTSVRANFLGNRTVPDMHPFEFMAEDLDRRLSPPDQKRTTGLEFFFLIVEGTLQLDIEYSENYHQAATIQKLGSRYLELMQDLLQSVETASTPTMVASTSESDSVQSTSTLSAQSTSTLSAQPTSTLSLMSVNPQSTSTAMTSSLVTPTMATALTTPQAMMNGNPPLKGKVALITGGGNALGIAIAQALMEKGAHIALIDYTQDRLQLCAQQLQTVDSSGLTLAVDMNQLGAVQDSVEQINHHWGRIDILVNNSNNTLDFKPTPLTESNPQHWREIIEANLFSTYNYCYSAIPHLLMRESGKIINIGSDSAFVGYPFFSAHAAAKHAIAGLTKSLAEELKHKNIQVNAVCPSFMETNQGMLAYLQESIPVEHVAELVAFLASPQANSMTGECLKLSGKQDLYWLNSRSMFGAMR